MARRGVGRGVVGFRRLGGGCDLSAFGGVFGRVVLVAAGWRLDMSELLWTISLVI